MLSASDISPKMFENPFLDFFSRTPWWAVPALYLPYAALLVWWGIDAGTGAALAVLMIPTGFVLWTLAEYWLHRTLFHWEPDTWWGPKLHFFLHGVHHVHHRDPYRLVMPPAASAVLAVVFYYTFLALGMAGHSLLGIDPSWYLPCFAGFVVGYVTYDVMHYALHHFRPRSAWMKRLRAHHMNHHHNHPELKFGVSNQFWDKVFGTA